MIGRSNERTKLIIFFIILNFLLFLKLPFDASLARFMLSKFCYIFCEFMWRTILELSYTVVFVRRTGPAHLLRHAMQLVWAHFFLVSESFMPQPPPVTQSPYCPYPGQQFPPYPQPTAGYGGYGQQAPGGSYPPYMPPSMPTASGYNSGYV